VDFAGQLLMQEEWGPVLRGQRYPVGTWGDSSSASMERHRTSFGVYLPWLLDGRHGVHEIHDSSFL
jgi:hypothetical protein